jgi:hypothetical protein
MKFNRGGMLAVRQLNSRLEVVRSTIAFKNAIDGLMKLL